METAGAVTGRPDPFPWLAHLRTDRRGLPVPYINAWGTERELRVAHDPLVGRDAVFFDDHGDTPDFTRQSYQRQRRCVLEGLCQVCGKPVPWSRRNLALASMSVDWVRVEQLRREVPVVSEPWLCDRCAAIATTWCPALIRRSRDEKLQVVAVRSPRDVQLVVAVGSVDQPGLEWTQDRPVVMHAKVRLLSVDIRRETDPHG